MKKYRNIISIVALVLTLALLGGCGKKEQAEAPPVQSDIFLPNFNSAESAKMGAFMNGGYFLINEDYTFRTYTDALEYIKLRVKENGEYVFLPKDDVESFYIYDIQNAYYLGEGPDKILYFINGNNEIESMPIGSEDHKVISEGVIYTLQVANDRLYYTKNEDSRFYCAKLDGTGEEKILDKEVYYPYVIGDYILYQDDADGESIHLYNMNSERDVKVLDGPAYCPNIVGNWLFCYVKDTETKLSQIVGVEFQESGETVKKVINVDNKHWYADMINFHYEVDEWDGKGYGVLAFGGAHVLNYGDDSQETSEYLTYGVYPAYLLAFPDFSINGSNDERFYSSEYGHIYGENYRIEYFDKTMVFEGALYEEGSDVEANVKSAMEDSAANNAADSVDSSSAVGKAGYYAIESMTMDGETVDATFFEDMGINYFIRLHDDHTAEINTDTLLKGTWENGELRYIQDGEEYVNKYELDVDVLTIDASADGSEVIMVFKRSEDPTK